MEKILKWLLLVGGVLVFLAVAPSAASQERSRRRMTPQLALAILTVHEAGWEADADMRGIHAVILRMQERNASSSYVGAASAYARRLLGGQGETNRPWLRSLNPEGTQPEGWPDVTWVRTSSGESLRRRYPPWSAYRAIWLRTYARAGEVVQYRLDDWASWGPCSDIPDDWGGSIDRERAQRLGLIRLSCASTRNDFYMRPSTIASRESLGG